MKIEELYKEVEINDNDVIVFGCSYGPDSMALFKTLLLLREKKDIQLVCAHVHHGKRKESDEEKILLEEYCKAHHVVFEYMKIDHYGDDNFHNEARNIRYQFFNNIVQKYQAKYLMTAHHADDLMETILMRIARGSTLDGYSGFKKRTNLQQVILYRPFIEYTKEELVAFDQKYRVPYAIDASNESDVYTRNRYRHTIIPFLKQEDKNIHEKFLKFSRELQETSQFIGKQVKQAKKKVMKDQVILINRFLEQDKFLQKRILEDMLQQFYQDDLILIGEKHIQLLFKLITSKKANATVSLPNDVIAVKKYNELSIQKHTDILSSYEIEVSDYVMLPNHHILKKIVSSSENSNNITRLSSKDITLPLIVRTRQVGDTIAMKGGGHKKVKDIFIDKKISLKERDRWPIVVDSNQKIVFIPGLKKSKFDRKKDEFYDIIIKYE